MTTIVASQSAMTIIMASPIAMTAIAASQTAMNVVVTSQTAMTAIAAIQAAVRPIIASPIAMTVVTTSQSAMAAIIASPNAVYLLDMNDQALRIWMLTGTNLVYSNFANVAAVAASSTAMTTITASPTTIAAIVLNPMLTNAINNNDQALRIWMLAGTNQVYSNFANVAAVAASSTAMKGIAASKSALLACWASEAALSAIRNSSTAVDALVKSSYTVDIKGDPLNLMQPIVASRSILLQSKNNGNGNDTDYLSSLYSNGARGSISYIYGTYSYTTSTSYTTQVVAFTDIHHYQKSDNEYQWEAYIIDCNLNH
jgi:hypothetical protein